MKSALLALALFFSFTPQVLAADPVEHDARCEAIYVNGVGVPNGGTYPTTLKSGETFHAEIKMKNTGTRSWLKLQNYKLGNTDDSLQFGTSRADISNSNPIDAGSEVVFAFDPVNKFSASGTQKFAWQMLKERVETTTEEGGDQVIDPGGRFGQICSINLNIEGSKTAPATETPSQPTVKSPEMPKTPSIKTSTMCTDPTKGVREISADWSGYTASSVRVFLKSGTKLIDQSSCLGSGTQNHTFSKISATSDTYQVGLVPYADSSCGRADLSAPAGGYSVNVAGGGFKYPNMSGDPKDFMIKTIYFDIDGQRSYYTCSPLEFSLVVPSGKSVYHSFDTPMNILLTRYALGTNGTVQRNDINTSHPFIIRYRPVVQNEEGGLQKAPAPSSMPKTNTPSTNTQEGGEP